MAKMYCPHCGKEIEDTFLFCPHCGAAVSPPRTQQTQPSGGGDPPPYAQGNGQQPPYPPYQSAYPPPYAVYSPNPSPYGQAGPTVPPVYQPRNRLAAGIRAILIGFLGIHNFYLGYTGRAVAQLLITVLSCGILVLVSQIWAIVEGVQILTGHIVCDAHGVPMVT